MPTKLRVATLGSAKQNSITFLPIGNSDESGVAKIRQTARKKTNDVQRSAFGVQRLALEAR
jgi:hypothetical protein